MGLGRQPPARPAPGVPALGPAGHPVGGHLSFALSWNDFTFAFLLQTDRKMFTLPVGLATFVEQTGVHWGMVMAAAVLVSVPTFLLVFFLQRYLLSGLRTAG